MKLIEEKNTIKKKNNKKKKNEKKGGIFTKKVQNCYNVDHYVNVI